MLRAVQQRPLCPSIMLSTIGHALPFCTTPTSKNTTTGFVTEATDMPGLSEASWIAFSPSPLRCLRQGTLYDPSRWSTQKANP